MKILSVAIAVSVAVAPTALPDVAGEIGIQFVEIGDPGNPPDPYHLPSRIGDVAYRYRIGVYEVTNAQYTAFLNAVDPYGADNNFLVPSSGDIERDLFLPVWKKYFTSKPTHPVEFVSWTGALSFVNWLNSGNVDGGAYDEYGVRLSSAQYWLPSESEWYKAAYYRGPQSGLAPVYGSDYARYPTGMTINSVDAPGDQASANTSSESALPVGSYPLARSHYGTYDQAGNVGEKTELGDMGGSYWTGNESADSINQPYGAGGIGFRVAARTLLNRNPKVFIKSPSSSKIPSQRKIKIRGRTRDDIAVTSVSLVAFDRDWEVSGTKQWSAYVRVPRRAKKMVVTVEAKDSEGGVGVSKKRYRIR